MLTIIYITIIIDVFADIIVADAFFLMLINAITDEKNMACPKGLVPIAIGVTNLGLLLLAFGYNTGGPINPARDFSPRLFSCILYGSKVWRYLLVFEFQIILILVCFFSAGSYYFWVPLVACHLGGVLGSWLYVLCIETHWPKDSFDLTTNESENYQTANNNGKAALKRIQPA